jgi:hypothetical protein
MHRPACYSGIGARRSICVSARLVLAHGVGAGRQASGPPTLVLAHLSWRWVTALVFLLGWSAWCWHTWAGMLGDSHSLQVLA